jgi:hypothetical protein
MLLLSLRKKIKDIMSVMRLSAALCLLSIVVLSSADDSCRSLTAEYLRRSVNGPQSILLEKRARNARERLTEAELSALHPAEPEEGRTHSDPPRTRSGDAQAELKAAQDALAVAEAERSTFLETTNANVSGRLPVVCNEEAQRLGQSGLMAQYYIARESALGWSDSIRETFSSIGEVFGSQANRDLRLIQRHFTGAAGALEDSDNYVTLAKTLFLYCSGLILTCLTLYIVLGLVLPATTFYYVGYQYVWLVWIKVFFLEGTLHALARQHPTLGLGALLWKAAMGTPAAQLVTLGFGAAILLMVSLATLVFLPWLVAVFHFPKRRPEGEA